MNTSNIHLLELLQDQFCLNDLDGAREQNVWIMAASFTQYAESHLPTTIDTGIDNPTHTVRIVLRTTDEVGTNDYVDGTDIFVTIDEETQIATFEWEDLWIEGPPIFHGGTVLDALKWVQQLNEPFHTQIKDPFLSPAQRISLNGHDEDYLITKLPEQLHKEKALDLASKDLGDLF